jgi:DNA-binding phage protein
MSTKITFAEWVGRVEKTGREKADVAADLGISLTSLYRYLANDRVPTKTVMARILDRSGGLVDVTCFYASAQGRAA